MGKLRNQRVGLFAVDPGTTTGVATAAVTLRGSTKEIFERDPLETYEVKCSDPRSPQPQTSELAGAAQMAQMFRDACHDWTAEDIPATRHFLIIEDFNLRGKPGSLDRTGLSPVRVTSALLGMLYGFPKAVVFQQPEQAKSRWTTPRMKNSGLWVVGSEHKRDATRHAALFVVKKMK